MRTYLSRKERRNCLQTLRVGWKAEEGITKACEKLLGKMDTHGVCMHANTHHVGNYICVVIVCNSYISQAVISAEC